MPLTEEAKKKKNKQLTSSVSYLQGQIKSRNAYEEWKKKNKTNSASKAASDIKKKVQGGSQYGNVTKKNATTTSNSKYGSATKGRGLTKQETAYVKQNSKKIGSNVKAEAKNFYNKTNVGSGKNNTFDTMHKQYKSDGTIHVGNGGNERHLSYSDPTLGMHREQVYADEAQRIADNLYASNAEARFMGNFAESLIDNSIFAVPYTMATGKKLSESDFLSSPIYNANPEWQQTADELRAKSHEGIAAGAGRMAGMATNYAMMRSALNPQLEQATTAVMNGTRLGEAIQSSATLGKIGQKVGAKAAQDIGRGLVKETISDATLGFGQNALINYGEGLRGEDFWNQQAKDTLFDFLVGGAMEGAGVGGQIRRAGKQAKEILGRNPAGDVAEMASKSQYINRLKNELTDLINLRDSDYGLKITNASEAKVQELIEEYRKVFNMTEEEFARYKNGLPLEDVAEDVAEETAESEFRKLRNSRLTKRDKTPSEFKTPRQVLNSRNKARQTGLAEEDTYNFNNTRSSEYPVNGRRENNPKRAETDVQYRENEQQHWLDVQEDIKNIEKEYLPSNQYRFIYRNLDEVKADINKLDRLKYEFERRAKADGYDDWHDSPYYTETWNRYEKLEDKLNDEFIRLNRERRERNLQRASNDDELEQMKALYKTLSDRGEIAQQEIRRQQYKNGRLTYGELPQKNKAETSTARQTPQKGLSDEDFYSFNSQNNPAPKESEKPARIPESKPEEMSNARFLGKTDEKTEAWLRNNEIKETVSKEADTEVKQPTAPQETKPTVQQASAPQPKPREIKNKPDWLKLTPDKLQGKGAMEVVHRWAWEFEEANRKGTFTPKEAAEWTGLSEQKIRRIVSRDKNLDFDKYGNIEAKDISRKAAYINDLLKQKSGLTSPNSIAKVDNEIAKVKAMDLLEFEKYEDKKIAKDISNTVRQRGVGALSPEKAEELGFPVENGKVVPYKPPKLTELKSYKEGATDIGTKVANLRELVDDFQRRGLLTKQSEQVVYDPKTNPPHTLENLAKFAKRSEKDIKSLLDKYGITDPTEVTIPELSKMTGIPEIALYKNRKGMRVQTYYKSIHPDEMTVKTASEILGIPESEVEDLVHASPDMWVQELSPDNVTPNIRRNPKRLNTVETDEYGLKKGYLEDLNNKRAKEAAEAKAKAEAQAKADAELEANAYLYDDSEEYIDYEAALRDVRENGGQRRPVEAQPEIKPTEARAETPATRPVEPESRSLPTREEVASQTANAPAEKYDLELYTKGELRNILKKNNIEFEGNPKKPESIRLLNERGITEWNEKPSGKGKPLSKKTDVVEQPQPSKTVTQTTPAKVETPVNETKVEAPVKAEADKSLPTKEQQIEDIGNRIKKARETDNWKNVTSKELENFLRANGETVPRNPKKLDMQNRALDVIDGKTSKPQLLTTDKVYTDIRNNKNDYFRKRGEHLDVISEKTGKSQKEIIENAENNRYLHYYSEENRMAVLKDSDYPDSGIPKGFFENKEYKKIHSGADLTVGDYIYDVYRGYGKVESIKKANGRTNFLVDFGDEKHTYSDNYHLIRKYLGDDAPEIKPSVSKTVADETPHTVAKATPQTTLNSESVSINPSKSVSTSTTAEGAYTTGELKRLKQAKFDERIKRNADRMPQASKTIFEKRGKDFDELCNSWNIEPDEKDIFRKYLEDNGFDVTQTGTMDKVGHFASYNVKPKNGNINDALASLRSADELSGSYTSTSSIDNGAFTMTSGVDGTSARKYNATRPTKGKPLPNKNEAKLNATRPTKENAKKKMKEKLGKGVRSWAKSVEDVREHYTGRRTFYEGDKAHSKAHITYMNAQITPEEFAKQMMEDAELGLKNKSTWKSILGSAEERYSKDSKGMFNTFMSNFENGRQFTDQDLADAYVLMREFGKNRNLDDFVRVEVAATNGASMAGKTLSAQKIFKALTPEGRVLSAINSIERLGKNHNLSLKIDEKLIDNLYNAKTDEEILKASKELGTYVWNQIPPTLIEKVNAWRYLSMLGNLKTHGRNVLGNGGMAMLRGISDVVATPIERAFGKRLKDLGGDITARHAILNPFSKNDRALKKLGEEQFKSIKASMDLGSAMGLGGNKYYKRRPDGSPIFKSKLFSKYEKVTNTGLEFEDVVAMRENFASEFAQICKANGLDPKKIEGKTLAKINKQAYNEATKATFRDPNILAEAFNRVRNMARVTSEDKGLKKFGKMAAGAAMDATLPFVKTPLNILKRGTLEYSPFGVARGLAGIYNAKTADNLLDAIGYFSNGLTGSAVMGLGLYLGYKGRMNGNLGSNITETSYKKTLGEQNYAVTIGDRSFTLDWIAPTALPLFVGVEAGSKMKNDGLTEKGMWDFVEAMSNISEPILELSMLQGVDNIFSTAFSDETGIAKIAKNAAFGYASQFIPTVIGQASRTFGGNRRIAVSTAENSLQRELEKNFGNLASKVAPLSSVVNQEYVDQWGRTAENGGALENFLSPFYMKKSNVTEVDNEILRLYDTLDETEKEGLIPRFSASAYVQKYNDKEYRMTPDQYTEYKKTVGQAKYNGLKELFETEKYKNASDSEKKDMIDDVYKEANQKGKKEFLMEADKEFAEAPDYYMMTKDQQSKWNDTLGMSKEDWAKAYNAKLQANRDKQARIGKDLTDAEKMAVLRENGVTTLEQARSIDGNIGKTISMTDKNSESKWESEFNSGKSFEEVSKEAEEKYERQKDMTPEEIKFDNNFRTNSYERYTKNKIRPQEEYDSFVDYVWKADSDGNGSIKQDEAYSAIEALGKKYNLSNEQKAYYWYLAENISSDGKRWKKQPYGTYVPKN